MWSHCCDFVLVTQNSEGKSKSIRPICNPAAAAKEFICSRRLNQKPAFESSISRLYLLYIECYYNKSYFRARQTFYHTWHRDISCITKVSMSGKLYVWMYGGLKSQMKFCVCEVDVYLTLASCCFFLPLREPLGAVGRFTITPQRHYPLQQPGVSSVGVLPPVKWDGFRKKNILSPRNSPAALSPVTVKIARPDHHSSPRSVYSHRDPNS